jgi:hypothetical protein
MFSNIWNNIVAWFKDLSERNRLINSFNSSARDAYVTGDAPALLQASISKGNSSYRHDFSKWLSSGFRIKVFCGRQLNKDEIVFIGNSILSNQILLRRLVVLGWDTLEIHGDKGSYGCQWKIIDYLDKINLIGSSIYGG